MIENVFLKDLLSLQQDGRGAISSPATWGSKPLLQVSTYLDQTIDGLATSLRKGLEDQSVAPWHFFVGSPGNGKSAGTGELVQRLIVAGFVIKDVEGTSLEDLPKGHIPYELHVFAPAAKFPCAYIAQDASVVPNPFDPDADPAVSLCDLLERASGKGVAMLVCTNRGVLERAFARNYLQSGKNQTLWFRAISVATLGEPPFTQQFPEGQKKVFASADVQYTNLDQKSLLIGRDTFEALLEKAVSNENWSGCSGCSVQKLCPFFQNRSWLKRPESRKAVIEVVREAEILSGQIIVFREALALISLILAGCPHDYQDGSPCAWVLRNASVNSYFMLLSRRIYMVLFSSFTAFGLEEHSADAREQRKGIDHILRLVSGEKAAECHAAVAPVIRSKSKLSTDVGVERLLGSRGIFRAIDAFSDIAPREFYVRWDDEGQDPFLNLGDNNTELERKCAEIWTILKESAETRGDNCHEPFRWLKRWITAFSYRAGALADLQVVFKGEIDQLYKILSVPDKPSDDDVRLIGQIEAELWKMLQADGAGTKISPYGRLKGEWAHGNLRARIDKSATASGQAIVLQLKFGKKTFIPLSAQVFAWLKRRIDRRMSEASFPIEYLRTAEDALVRAASESQYSLASTDVELVVTRPPDEKGGSISMKRFDGRVIIDGL